MSDGDVRDGQGRIPATQRRGQHVRRNGAVRTAAVVADENLLSSVDEAQVQASVRNRQRGAWRAHLHFEVLLFDLRRCWAGLLQQSHGSTAVKDLGGVVRKTGAIGT